MKIIEFTDPLSGLPFTCVVDSDSLIVDSPVSEKKLRFRINHKTRMVEIPYQYFTLPHLLPAPKAAKILNVTKQRLLQLEKQKALDPYFIGNRKYYIISQLLNYTDNKRPYVKRKSQS